MKTHGLCHLVGLLCLSTVSSAKAASEMKTPGIVEAPVQGSTMSLTLEQLPTLVRHAAELAFRGYSEGYTITRAQVDMDDIEAVYEVQAKSSDGRFLEADVSSDGKIMELEVEITREEVPAEVAKALSTFAPGFALSTEGPAYEKSFRPSANGLLEIWYEFSGTNFDVEINSNGTSVLIEPA